MSKYEAFWKSLGYSRVTSDYGVRVDPFTKKQSFHQGIDVVKVDKAPIEAVVGGDVVFAGMAESGTGLGGYGNVVAIKDAAGHLHVYAHLTSVKVGKGKVEKGTVIGTQGSTGRSAGSHLHFEIRKKSAPSFGFMEDRQAMTVDPSEYVMNLLSAKATPKAEAKPAPKAAKPSGKTYKVASGDTLSEIAKAHNTTVAKIMAANPAIKDASKIRAGQTINVG